MSLTPIFADEEQNETDLWSIVFSEYCEFDNAFSNWFDSEYLLEFFKKNYEDLFNGFYDIRNIEEAVELTLNEAEEFEEYLLENSFKLTVDNQHVLDKIFKPLNNNDYQESDLQKNKIRPKYGISWLRLYAIRLRPNSFVVSGGAIKLTKKMERPHLVNELSKLDRTKDYLSAESIVDSDDINKLLL
jgi:hypothetical protein